MQLNPRYEGDPLITLDGPPSGIVAPTVGQRRRLADVLSRFTSEQWDHPSRCDGWTTRDVIVHLSSTNAFWAYSLESGLRGEPTRLLATFDPVETPASIVAAAEDVPDADVLARFVASTDKLVDLLSSVADGDWTLTAESPPGHVPLDVMAHHALWDSWVHERDIMLPLGLDPVEDADEVTASLRYAAALGPALAAVHRPGRRGELVIAATDPDVDIVVEVGKCVRVRDGGTGTGSDVRLTGGAVSLVEALSMRGPFEGPVPEAWTWMLSGLAEAFDIDPDTA